MHVLDRDTQAVEAVAGVADLQGQRLAGLSGGVYSNLLLDLISGIQSSIGSRVQAGLALQGDLVIAVVADGEEIVALASIRDAGNYLVNGGVVQLAVLGQQVLHADGCSGGLTFGLAVVNGKGLVTDLDRRPIGQHIFRDLKGCGGHLLRAANHARCDDLGALVDQSGLERRASRVT